MKVTDIDKAECLNDYFSQVFTIENMNIPFKNDSNNYDMSLNDIVISEDRVFDELNKLDTNKKHQSKNHGQSEADHYI